MDSLIYKTNYNSVTCNSSEFLSDIDLEDKKVNPQKFLVYSFSCQKQAAHIRNRLIESIKEKDSAMVAFRYLQSSQAQSNVRFEAVFYCIYSAIALCFYNVKPIESFTCLLIVAPQVIINARNTVRYKETTRLAKCGAFSGWQIISEPPAGFSDTDIQGRYSHKPCRQYV